MCLSVYVCVCVINIINILIPTGEAYTGLVSNKCAPCDNASDKSRRVRCRLRSSHRHACMCTEKNLYSYLKSLLG